MDEVILNNEDISLLVYIVNLEILKVGPDMPAGSNLPRLYEKLLDIAEMQGE